MAMEALVATRRMKRRNHRSSSRLCGYTVQYQYQCVVVQRAGQRPGACLELLFRFKQCVVAEWFLDRVSETQKSCVSHMQTKCANGLGVPETGAALSPDSVDSLRR